MDFYNSIDKFEEKIAIFNSENDYLTYAQLICEADKFKSIIKERHLAFNLCDNTEESIVGYIGFLRSNVPQALINSSMDLEKIDNLINKYNPQYLWVSKQRVQEFENYSVILDYKDYRLLEAKESYCYEIHKDLAVLITTSGSTGSPKFVRQSYKNICSNANSIAQYLEIKSDDRPITTLPMSYTYGLSIINSHFLKGCTVVVTNKTLMDKGFWDLLKASKASTFGGVPYTYEILKKLRFDRMSTPSLKILTQAGGKLGKELSKEFADICKSKNIRFFVMYGQTEATARMSYLPYEYALTKAGSIGIAIPGGEFCLEDDNGNIINDSDVTGELIYKGDNVTMGYSENLEQLELGDTRQGILKTGDMAKRDSDGFYYIVGRKKRFLKMFGSRVNLDELENLLKVEGFEAACAGQDDNLKIYTISEKSVDSIKDYISNNIKLNIKGFSVVCIDEIPRNDAGKVLYSALK